ncbi:MAG: dihydroorotase [Bacteroidales bacterium]
MYIYLKGGKVINIPKNILIENDRIKKVSNEDISDLPNGTKIVDCTGLIIFPGVVDVHVHFREPGNEDKADMESESKAALRGGVTTVCDMPNNTPSITTTTLFLDKIELAKKRMNCNFKLFFGITNDNIDEAIQLNSEYLAGLKLFLGSSTGNMLVNSANAIDKLFKKTDKIIVAHCEDENMIFANKIKYEHLSSLPCNVHCLIRDTDVCFASSKFAVNIAKKYNTNLHIAHLTTAKEISLLSNECLDNKRITSEVSPNHLYFCEKDYQHYGNLIKCNPSIKSFEDRQALRNALKEGYIDIVATDHAPHLWDEKQKDYFAAPSGIPSIQFSLLMMLEIASQEGWDLQLIADKMCKNPVKRFGIEGRGEVKEGYFADLTIINPNRPTTVTKDMILSKCKWSPLINHTFKNSIEMTIINGEMMVYY